TSTLQHFNTSTLQHFNTLTLQHFNPFQSTTFTILPFTTILFRGVLPSAHFLTTSEASTVFSMSSCGISSANFIFARTRPLIEMGYSNSSSLRNSSLYWGNVASNMLVVLPSFSHNSSAM